MAASPLARNYDPNAPCPPALVSRLRHGRDYQEEDEDVYDDDEYDEDAGAAFAPDLDAAAAGCHRPAGGLTRFAR